MYELFSHYFSFSLSLSSLPYLTLSPTVSFSSFGTTLHSLTLHSLMDRLRKEGLSHDTALKLIGFLGGTESNEASDRCLYHALRKKDKEIKLEFERDGAEAFENVVSKITCERLCESCDEILSETLKMKESSRKFLLDDIKSPNKRYSLRLSPKCPIVSKALNEVCSKFYPFLSEQVGANALLYELSVIISDSGSRAQQFHSDTQILGRSSEKDALLITIFVALQDVNEDMGPTLLYPRTHTRRFHELYFGKKNSNATAQLAALGSVSAQTSMTLRQGSGFAMNSRLLHCGGANTSKSSRRRLLCVSFLGSNGNVPHGSTASLIDEFKNKIRLRDIFTTKPSS